MMTPEVQIPAPIQQLLANATPKQIAKLTRDIQTRDPRDG